MRTVLPAAAMRGDSTACQTPRANPRPADAQNANGPSGSRDARADNHSPASQRAPRPSRGRSFRLAVSCSPAFCVPTFFRILSLEKCGNGCLPRRQTAFAATAAHLLAKFSHHRNRRGRRIHRQPRRADAAFTSGSFAATDGAFPPSQSPRTAHSSTASPRRCRSHLRQLRRRGRHFPAIATAAGGASIGSLAAAAIVSPYSVSTSSESRPRMTRVPCPGDDSISIVCPRRARMRLHRYSPMPVARRSPSRPLKPV